MQVITVNGIRTHLAITGDPDGAPLVFANSLGTDFRIWDRVLPLLPPGLRVLRYDMRGHGLSDAPAGDYFMGDLVADAAGADAGDGLPRRRLRRPLDRRRRRAGAGGRAAGPRELAVLSNTAAKIGTEESWRDRMATVRAGGIEAIADRVMQHWFTQAFHADRPTSWRSGGTC